jgi:hypothetical protein
VKRLTQAAAAAAIAAASIAALAQPNAGSAADAERQLRSGGYALVSTDRDGRRQWQYWWNPRRHDCRLVTTQRADLVSSVLTSETDCGQWRDESRMSERGRAAIAAARSLRVDALLHRSHERDVNRYQAVNEIAEFERGYRDGRDGRRLDRRHGSPAYSDGYRAGEHKRTTAVRPEQPTLPPGSLPPEGSRPTYPKMASPHDLVGRPAHELETTMQSLGYRRWLSGSTSSRDFLSVWRGPNSASECIQAIVRGDLVLDIRTVNEDQCAAAPSR